MTSYSDPNKKTPDEASTELKVDAAAATQGSDDFKPYTAAETKAKPNWLWVLPLILLTLAVGLFAGRMWGQKQLEDNSAETQRSVVPEGGTATGITEIEKPVNQKPVLTVETVTPTQSSVANDISADGTISPETTSSVSGKVSGVAIDQVLVQEGARVKKGQVLAVFDTDAMRQQIIQSQAELAEAQSSYDLAKRDAERVLPLLEINAISQQEADRYVATANQAAASVAASKARLNNQNLNMQNAKVVAPVSGVISEKNANVGSVPGPEPLFTIIEEGKLEWQAQVDPNKVGEINIGTPVEVSLPNNKSVAGKVTRISPTAEDGSRQITIYAALAPNPNARAGMYQRGTFKLGSDAKVTIPVSAVVSEDGYDYVMQVKAVKDENRDTIYRVNRVKVKLGERQGDRVVLLEPLQGDGNIVRQGGSFLSDGDVVTLATATPEPAK
ncbi:efflux RND transporter periplasmic adaptor subunit [Psychrobacter sp. YP14]|jgi:RND family efflux transporter MFP subunit|uniref:Efflux RND transporter periplasmic adaptor subunit n=2 Tax=Psychrobacter TaxID=497 RepID=A0A844M0P8_9GAMM|nr:MULTISPECIES: efflux RND transporter periplasmic adaptor subunit [Psychrobacter]AWT50049.1 efflux RND transporter periplasmic adaptor subunit [Psychrobacter sp. YP14]MUG32541.1 efflux RND transporter periplasmic adaptor subunit [Psychrobacter sanguinis]